MRATFDGLSVEWGNSNFVNPPYDKLGKEAFIRKSFEEWNKGKTVVLLIPVSTSTKIFHEIIYPNSEIRFVKGRIKFKGLTTKGEYTETGSPKHDSMIVIFKAKIKEDESPS